MSTTIRTGPVSHIDPRRVERLDAYWRATNYLGAAQLYLRDNPLLREPLAARHIKPRLLGHWGTQPGLNLIYAHLNRLIQDTGASIMLVVGPGHGGPAVFANQYIEGSLGAVRPELTSDLAGMTRFVRQFAWPYGEPSHLHPGSPGTIHEGAELGYSLAHAFGAAFDNPDLLVACVVGDGEAETGPLAAAWHSTKFLNPATSGAVLPILHLNGYKLSGPAILARMTNRELDHLFTGYGYRACFVEGNDPAAVHPAMWEALDWAYREIGAIQQRARLDGVAAGQPTWPMVILRTPKGWTGPATVDGVRVEGTFHSHQVPLADAATNAEHLAMLEAWLRSYHPDELFDEEGRPTPEIVATTPGDERRMGMNRHANGGGLLVPLELPRLGEYAVDVPAPGEVEAAATRELGGYLRDVFRLNEGSRNFRLFCPDETSSNRLERVYEVTQRAFIEPLVATDEHLSRDGRVMEILSEHTCQGWLEGYLLTGRHGMLACYEAFMPIVDSMVNQYGKWLKAAREVPWRKPIASLNILLTSHVWRQDHNGYSHQEPSFINIVLEKKATVARIYLPPDANCLLAVADHCLRSRDYINLIVANKEPMPQWLSPDAAREHCARGASAWEWAGNDAGGPDVVLAAAGDTPTLEIIAAAGLLRQTVPELRVRVVNVVDLFALVAPDAHPHGLDEATFAELFTVDRPVVFAFHGYPRTIHELVHHRPRPERFHVRGFIEEGSTTTPFDMTVRNRISRYDLAMLAVAWAPEQVRNRAGATLAEWHAKLVEHDAYVREHGVDMPEITTWRWDAA